MPTLVKEFNFVTDTEGWVATTTEATIDTGWYPPHRSDGGSSAVRSHSYDPILSLLGGCLKMTAKQNTGFSENNYWELTKTWEELGVPVGAIVTDVQADYLYKWDMGIGGAGSIAKYQNKAEINGDKTWFGPFHLLDSGGSYLDVFSTEEYCINRGAAYSAPYWKYYPTATAEYPLSYIPNGWGHKVGSSVAVTGGNQASNSQLKFRLYQTTPQTDVWGGPGTEPMWVRMKTDYIVLTITYTMATNNNEYYFAFQ